MLVSGRVYKKLELWHFYKLVRGTVPRSRLIQGQTYNPLYPLVSGRVPLGDVGPGLLDPCYRLGGWKLLHADVFRAPKHRLFFCSVSGFQHPFTGQPLNGQQKKNGERKFWDGFAFLVVYSGRLFYSGFLLWIFLPDQYEDTVIICD